jgi:hypothetical protein
MCGLRVGNGHGRGERRMMVEQVHGGIEQRSGKAHVAPAAEEPDKVHLAARRQRGLAIYLLAGRCNKKARL